MILKKTTLLLVSLISSIAVAQESNSTTKNNFNFIGVGYTMGQTMPPTKYLSRNKNATRFRPYIGYHYL